MFMKSLAVALSLAVAVPAFAVPASAAGGKVVHRTVVKEKTVVHRGKEARHDRRDARQQQRNWRHRGGRVPAQYRGRGVDDWQRHGLRRPGNGQRWVRVDNDYLLVAAASGFIASIVAASR